jgi:hypothetical protein
MIESGRSHGKRERHGVFSLDWAKKACHAARAAAKDSGQHASFSTWAEAGEDEGPHALETFMDLLLPKSIVDAVKGTHGKTCPLPERLQHWPGQRQLDMDGWTQIRAGYLLKVASLSTSCRDAQQVHSFHNARQLSDRDIDQTAGAADGTFFANRTTDRSVAIAAADLRSGNTNPQYNNNARTQQRRVTFNHDSNNNDHQILIDELHSSQEELDT